MKLVSKLRQHIQPNQVPMLSLAIVFIFTGCSTSSQDWPGPSPVPGIATSADPEKFSVLNLESFYSDAMQAAHIEGQDGGAALLLPDGSALWVYGDTLLERGVKEPPAVSNSAALLDPSTGSFDFLVDGQGIARHVLPFIEEEEWEFHRLWPGAGLSMGNTAYLFFERIVIEDKIHPVGPTFGMAWSEVDSLSFDQRIEELPFAPHSVVRQGDLLHLYGVKRHDGFDSTVIYGTVPADEISQPMAYSVVNERLVEDVFGQVNVIFSPFLDRYLMVHPGNPYERPRSIIFRTAKSPAGPFGEAVEAVVLPGELGDNWSGLLYVPYFHPELAASDGKNVVLSFCLVGEAMPNLVRVSFTDEARSDLLQ